MPGKATGAKGSNAHRERNKNCYTDHCKHKHFKFLPRAAFKICTQSVPCHSSEHSPWVPPSRAAAPSPARQGRDWLRACLGTSHSRPCAGDTEGPGPARAASQEGFSPVRSRESLQALQVRPLALNTTGHTAAQQGKVSLPSEPCSLHSTSGLLQLTWRK